MFEAERQADRVSSPFRFAEILRTSLKKKTWLNGGFPAALSKPHIKPHCALEKRVLSTKIELPDGGSAERPGIFLYRDVCLARMLESVVFLAGEEEEC